jgi:hypothetical protein
MLFQIGFVAPTLQKCVEPESGLALMSLFEIKCETTFKQQVRETLQPKREHQLSSLT